MQPSEMIEQGTPEWYAARCGSATGSMTHILMAGKSGKESVTRNNYMMQLACERITGVVHETFQSYHMKEGKRLEQFARGYYEADIKTLVDQVGFVKHETMEYWGVSPDGMIGDDGMTQIKCPIATTHWKFLQSLVIPRIYQLQMTAELICTNRKWSDFVSYNETLPMELRYKRVRFVPTNDQKQEVVMAVIKFLAEVENLTNEMKLMMKGKVK